MQSEEPLALTLTLSPQPSLGATARRARRGRIVGSPLATLRSQQAEREAFVRDLSRYHLRGAALRGPFALIFNEQLLAQTQVLRRRLDIFVRTNVFQSAFQRELEGRVQLDALAVALGAHVGKLFGFARVDRD